MLQGLRAYVFDLVTVDYMYSLYSSICLKDKLKYARHLLDFLLIELNIQFSTNTYVLNQASRMLFNV